MNDDLEYFVESVAEQLHLIIATAFATIVSVGIILAIAI